MIGEDEVTLNGPDELESFELDPQTELRPYISKGGKYGEGQQHGGRVLWTAFTVSCRRANKSVDDPKAKGRGPGFDRACERDDYSRFDFRVQLDEGGEVLVSEWQPLSRNSGGKTLPWLRALGACPPDSNTINPAEIGMSLPRSVAVEFGNPTPNKKSGGFYSGKVLNVWSL